MAPRQDHGRCLDLLADEPLAGLAPKDQELIAGVIRSKASEGCAVVVTGHDVHPLMDLAHEIVWVADGPLVALSGLYVQVGAMFCPRHP